MRSTVQVRSPTNAGGPAKRRVGRKDRVRLNTDPEPFPEKPLQEASFHDGEPQTKFGDTSDTCSMSSGGSSSVDDMRSYITNACEGMKVFDADGNLLQGEELIQVVTSSVSRAVRSLAPVAVMLMDTQCIVIDMNPKAEELFGLAKEELVGKNIKAIMPSETASKHDEYVAGYCNRYKEKKGPPRSSIVGAKEPQEVLAKRYNGYKEETFTAEIRVRGIPNPGGKHLPPLFFVGYIEDITARRELKQALEINQFIREKGDSALLVMTDAGKILDFNPAAARLFRYERHFIIGQNVKKLMPPEHAANHDEMLRRYRERVANGMLHTSPIVGKVRELEAWRPMFDVDGNEKFNIELRVEGFSGGQILVAFIRELGGATGQIDLGEKFMREQFPESAIERLVNDEPVWDAMDDVTVLFTDIPNFTALSEEMEPEELFTYVNSMFSAFDDIGYGMEKVKTLGDGYMAYFRNPDDAVYTAFRMLEWSSQNDVALKIGLHTGRTVAGVVGKRRRTYELWGATVTGAKRMEEQGQPGQIQISEECYDAISDDDLRETFEENEIAIKGKGRFVTFVSRFENGELGTRAMSLLAEREMEERQKQAASNMRDQRRREFI